MALALQPRKDRHTGRPSSVRLKDVASEAGVSVATASVVLNQPHVANRIGAACRQRVQDVAARLSYVANRHAQGMRGVCTNVIGVAVQYEHDLSRIKNHLATGYFGTLVGSIDETLRKSHQSMMILNGLDGLSAAEVGVQTLRRRQIDGLIVVGVTVEMDRNPVLLRPPEGFPIVAIEYNIRTDVPVIGFDERGGLNMAVAHLVEQGHRDILWLGSALDDRPGTRVSREHLFMQSVWACGLRAASCRYAEPPSEIERDEGTVDAAEASLRAYLQSGSARHCTAIVAYNDIVAIGAYRALSAQGLRVPQDVSVIGFDDIQARLLNPKLTSVSHVLPEMGARAVSLVLEMVAHPETVARHRGDREEIPTRLVVRASTGPRRCAH